MEKPDFYLTGDFLGRTLSCSCGQEHAIDTREVLVGKKVREAIPELCQRLVLGTKCHLVADENTWEAAGRELSDILEGAGFALSEIILPEEGGRRLEPDETGLKEITESIPSDCQFLIAVGSGTINDLTKIAAARAEKPYIVLATAPSMNGYTSSLGVVCKQGIKQVVPARGARAVVGDLEILCRAPLDMIKAGVGDMLSKYVSSVDWWLSHRVKGEYFCEKPIEMVAGIEDRYFADLPGIRERKEEAIGDLFRALVVSGLSMVVAGSSRPSSGGEHAISHFWDWGSAARGEPYSYHGIQVGVGTMITRRLYQEVLSFPVETLDLEARKKQSRDGKTQVEELRALFGEGGELVASEFLLKEVSWEEKEKELAKLKREWPEIHAELQRRLAPGVNIERCLKEMEAPTRPSEIGVSREDLRLAITCSRWIRPRYTVLDLASDLGILEDFASRYAEDYC